MAFAATFEAIQVAWSAKTVFKCHESKEKAITDGEVGFSKVLLNNSMNLDTLLLKYADLDWRDPQNWNCNKYRIPVLNGKYDDKMSVHPLETVFYKPLWLDHERVVSETYRKEVYAYLDWLVNKKRQDRLFKNNINK